MDLQELKILKEFTRNYIEAKTYVFSRMFSFQKQIICIEQPKSEAQSTAQPGGQRRGGAGKILENIKIFHAS